MANVDNPHGFRPIGELLRVTKYDVDVSNDVTISHNDLVTQETDGACTRLEAENMILGSVVCIRSAAGVPLKYLPATTIGTIYVADHPDQEFECQVNGTWAKAGEAGNYDITDTAGNTTTGISKQELAYNGATGAKHVKANRLLSEKGNAVGADANVVVTINQHQRAHGDGATGLA